MNAVIKLQGGCLCGAIRYATTALPFSSDHCHCSMCRKSVGAVVGTWMDFKVEQVTWLGEKPKEYASSEHTRRGFCPNCGGSISFRDHRHPEYFSLSTGSLDDPNLAPATCHIYVEDQIKWLKIDDECKRFKRGIES